MVDLLRQRIGIYYKNKTWGKECFDNIVKQIPKSMIAKLVSNKSEMFCTLKNGDVIRAVYAGEGARGWKFTSAVIQDGIDYNIMQNIIYPCIKQPVAIVKNVDEIVANYNTIEQELPRQEKKKQFRVVIKY